MEKIVVNVKCPYCKKSFMDLDKPIDGNPSIRVEIQYGNKKGDLYLSSIYGNYSIISEINLLEDEIVLFFCPECHASLLLKDLCEECKAPLAFFELKNGGMVQICSRRGCKSHSIDYSDLAQKISKLYSIYEKFADPSSKK